MGLHPEPIPPAHLPPLVPRLQRHLPPRPQALAPSSKPTLPHSPTYPACGDSSDASPPRIHSPLRASSTACLVHNRRRSPRRKTASTTSSDRLSCAQPVRSAPRRSTRWSCTVTKRERQRGHGCLVVRSRRKSEPCCPRDYASWTTGVWYTAWSRMAPAWQRCTSSLDGTSAAAQASSSWLEIKRARHLEH